MRYRCSHKQNGKGAMRDPCGARVSLKKHIDEYVKRPLCPSCGRDSLRYDKAHHVRKRALRCFCGGAPFTPHERGSIMGCDHYNKPYTEEEYRDMIQSMQEASKQ